MRSRLVELVRDRLVPDGTVGTRTIRSGIWAVGSNGLARGLQVTKLVVLANFLSQAQFGIAGFALLVLLGFRRFTNLGIREALIQHPDADVDAYLETAWAIRAVRGLLVATAVYLIAPTLAAVFADPAQEALTTDVLRAIALVPVFVGFQNPGMIYLRKDLEFHREFVYRVGFSAADAAVAVAAAVTIGNVWALVYGALAGAVGRLVLSFLVHDYRPGLGFDVPKAREMVGFGKWVTLSGIGSFLTTEGDDGFVMWYLGAGALGLYQTAYRLSNAPATELSRVVSGVVFPAYSKLQDDADALRDAYFQTLQLTTFLAFPAAAGLAAVAPTFVDAFINNPEWDLARLALVMQLLAVWGALRAIGATTGPLFRAVDRPDVETKIQLGKVVVIGVLVFPVTYAFESAAVLPAVSGHGLVGTSLVIIGASLFFSEPLATYLAVDVVEGSYGRLLELVAYPALASAGMAAVVWAAGRWVFDGGDIVALAALVALGVVVYALATVGLVRGGYDIDRPVRLVLDAVAGSRT